MNWYVVHTKPKQEQRALENLSRQGYECYLPTLPFERVINGKLTQVTEAMFPRYLFIRLDDPGQGRGLGPIRSTKGVSQLVKFGAEPARADPEIIEQIRRASEMPATKLFTSGQRVRISDGPFVGMEGIYQALSEADGESRALILIELLHKSATLRARLGTIQPLE